MDDKKQRKFLALYEPVHDRFERFCRARAFGQIEYRDLMNETLLIAFQKFSELKSEKAFLSFLCGTSIRILSNYAKKKRETYIEDLNLTELRSDARTDADIEIFLLHKALTKLPIEQRESLILFEISGFSIKEIAALHGVSESAVRQRLVRGRKKLVQLLTGNSISKAKTS